MVIRLCTFWLLGIALLSSRTADAESDRPNIVVVVADDMGWGDSATYGNNLIQTPNLDKLESQGVTLTQCYSAAGVCSPSRSAILTGRTSYRNGVWRHLSGNHEAHLRASEITYPELLKEIGYETCHVGKWHLLSKQQFNRPDYPQPSDQGYDYWFATQNNAKPVERNTPLFWRTHVSPPGDRVALRIGDWKLVGDEMLTKFQLYEVPKDLKEERDLAALTPEKTEEMKKRLIEVWKEIESEGPGQWWKSERQKPARGGKLNY